MPLNAGSRLGPYEIVAPLGAGGMGEVYRARDTKLNREVAIKVLPEVFAKDPERLARFEREAQVLASLNHPNIAQIHGLEASSDGPALVMELVEGETLAERMGTGLGRPEKPRPVPIDAALPIARQIADALEAAHSQGIVHRDLKPANVKLRPDGTVKVLDFGLAKALGTGVGSGGTPTPVPSMSPTLASPVGTLAGAILGTAAYMAPEQARGKTVDKRADIWAFGCVLFEMLTGTRAFGGEEITDTLAFILTKDPDWNALPPATLAPIRRLLRRCLEKDAQKRLHDIADARIEIDEAAAGGEIATTDPAPRAKGRERLAWSTAATLALILAAGAVVLSRRTAPALDVTRLDVATPASSDPISFAISPDGRQLAFVANADGVSKLWIRGLDQADAHVLAGTDDATLPFWSPDSRAIGFFSNGKLKRVDVSGAGLTTLANAPSGRGGTWNSDGVVVFAPSTSSGLMRIPAAGGDAVALTKLGDNEGSHRFPQFLPDGRHVFFAMAIGAPATRGTYVTSLDGGPPRRFMENDTTAVFARPDWLLFVNQGTLVARHFDPVGLTASGDPIVVDRNVGGDAAITLGAFSASSTVLAHRSITGVRRQLVWMDRAGKVLAALGAPDDASISGPDLSADGRRVAISRNTLQGSNDIWIIDVARAFPTRFTFDPASDTAAVWAADGSRVFFRSTRSGGGDLFEKSTNGATTEQLLLASSDPKSPVDMTPDGRLLLFVSTRPQTGVDLFALPLTGDRKPFPVVQTSFDESEGQFSPDVRWLTYTSNESGRQEIYVQPFPGPGEKVQVSSAGGAHPRWRRDGREVFYVAPDGSLMAASVNARPGTKVDVAAPAKLFAPHWATGSNILNTGGLQRPQYAVAADGRFLVNISVDEASLKPITVVLNWQSVLKK